MILLFGDRVNCQSEHFYVFTHANMITLNL